MEKNNDDEVSINNQFISELSQMSIRTKKQRICSTKLEGATNLD